MDPHLALGNANPRTASRLAMSILDTLQMQPAPETLMAAAYVFQVLLDQSGLRYPDVFQYLENMRATKDGEIPEFKAVRSYARNELNFTNS